MRCGRPNDVENEGVRDGIDEERSALARSDQLVAECLKASANQRILKREPEAEASREGGFVLGDAPKAFSSDVDRDELELALWQIGRWRSRGNDGEISGLRGGFAPPAAEACADLSRPAGVHADDQVLALGELVRFEPRCPPETYRDVVTRRTFARNAWCSAKNVPEGVYRAQIRIDSHVRHSRVERYS
jgi:hypothetical protein